MDLSKAYDKVPRTLLWEALRREGIEGTFLEAIQSIYDNAEINLSAGGSYGEHYKVRTGITQGPPISPSLFGIYSDGLIKHIEKTYPDVGPCTRDGRHVPILGFADDLKLLAKSLEELTHWTPFYFSLFRSYVITYKVFTIILVFILQCSKVYLARGHSFGCQFYL